MNNLYDKDLNFLQPDPLSWEAISDHVIMFVARVILMTSAIALFSLPVVALVWLMQQL